MADYTFSSRELSAGPKKKIDIWGGIKKVWNVAKGPILGLIKTAVSFIPGIGPIASNILGKGLSIIAPDVNTAGGIAGIIGAGKKLLKETPGLDLTAYVMEQAKAKGITLTPEMEKNVETGITTPGTVNVTDDTTVRNKLLNATKKVQEKEEVQETAGQKVRKTSEGIVYTLFARADPTMEETFKAKRKELNTAVKVMEKNIDIINKKMSKYFSPLFRSPVNASFKIKIDEIWQNLTALKEEMKTVTLSAEPFIKLNLTGGLTVLARYDGILKGLYSEVVKLNNDIDAYISTKGVMQIKKEEAKGAKQIQDITIPPVPPWLMPTLSIAGVTVLGAILIPKIIKRAQK